MQSFVYERVKSAIDCEAMMQLQAELVCAAMEGSAGDDDPREAVRRARRMLRRAWQRYGAEVVLLTREVGDAVLPAPG